MKKKKAKKGGGWLIRAQAWFNLLVCILSGCCLDTEGYTPMIVCFASAAWLMAYAFANGLNRYEED